MRPAFVCLLLWVPFLATVAFILLYWYLLAGENEDFEEKSIWILFNQALYLDSNLEEAETDFCLLKNLCMDLTLMGRKVDLFPFEGGGMGRKREIRDVEAELELDWKTGRTTNLTRALLWSQSALPPEVELILWVPGFYAYRNKTEAESDIQRALKVLEGKEEILLLDNHNMAGNIVTTMTIFHAIKEIVNKVGKVPENRTTTATIETSTKTSPIRTRSTRGLTTEKQTSGVRTTSARVQKTTLTTTSPEEVSTPWTKRSLSTSQTQKALTTAIPTVSGAHPTEQPSTGRKTTVVVTSSPEKTTTRTTRTAIQPTIPIISTEKTTTKGWTEAVTEISTKEERPSTTDLLTEVPTTVARQATTTTTNPWTEVVTVTPVEATTEVIVTTGKIMTDETTTEVVTRATSSKQTQRTTASWTEAKTINYGSFSTAKEIVSTGQWTEAPTTAGTEKQWTEVSTTAHPESTFTLPPVWTEDPTSLGGEESVTAAATEKPWTEVIRTQTPGELTTDERWTEATTPGGRESTEGVTRATSQSEISTAKAWTKADNTTQIVIDLTTPEKWTEVPRTTNYPDEIAPDKQWTEVSTASPNKLTTVEITRASTKGERREGIAETEKQWTEVATNAHPESTSTVTATPEAPTTAGGEEDVTLTTTEKLWTEVTKTRTPGETTTGEKKTTTGKPEEVTTSLWTKVEGKTMTPSYGDITTAPTTNAPDLLTQLPFTAVTTEGPSSITRIEQRTDVSTAVPIEISSQRFSESFTTGKGWTMEEVGTTKSGGEIIRQGTALTQEITVEPSSEGKVETWTEVVTTSTTPSWTRGLELTTAKTWTEVTDVPVNPEEEEITGPTTPWTEVTIPEEKTEGTTAGSWTETEIGMTTAKNKAEESVTTVDPTDGEAIPADALAALDDPIVALLFA